MKIFEFQFNYYWSVSVRSSWQYASIGLDNGLAPNRRQAIIWANADPIDLHIYAALGGDGLIAILLLSVICTLYLLQQIRERNACMLVLSSNDL